MAKLNLRRGVTKTHAERLQGTSHIMGGRSSSSSQKGFFLGSSFPFRLLSITSSSTLSSTTLCFFKSASTLQVWAAAGLGSGVSSGGESGLIISVAEVLMSLVVVSLCSPSSSCLLLSPALTGREGSLGGGGIGSACTVTMLLKCSDKGPISTKQGSDQGCITNSNTLPLSCSLFEETFKHVGKI